MAFIYIFPKTVHLLEDEYVDGEKYYRETVNKGVYTGADLIKAGIIP